MKQFLENKNLNLRDRISKKSFSRIDLRKELSPPVIKGELKNMKSKYRIHSNQRSGKLITIRAEKQTPECNVKRQIWSFA